MKNTYSITLMQYGDFRHIMHNIKKSLHKYVNKVFKTFQKSTYSNSDLFSFKGKSIQLPIQYLFSTYSVLGVNLFTNLFSFRGLFIQKCEQLFKAILVFLLSISCDRGHLWRFYFSIFPIRSLKWSKNYK